MTSFAGNLQFASLVVHETRIHDVAYDDIGPKTSRK